VKIDRDLTRLTSSKEIVKEIRKEETKKDP
jgi:hypothetical protein